MSVYSNIAFEALYNDGTAGKPFQTNSTRLITSAIMRQFAKDISDSFLSALDGANTDLKSFYSDDLINALNMFTSVGGGGSITQVTTGINSTEHSIGVYRAGFGTSPDYASIAINSSQNLLFGIGFEMTYSCRVCVTALSTAGQRYKLNLGFQDVFTAADPSNGAYFRYSDNINSGKFQCVTVAGGVETTTDSGVTPVATVNNVLSIRVDSTGSNAYFYIDGVLVQTHVANIPVGAAQLHAAGVKGYKTVGATSVGLDLDWHQLLLVRTTAR